MLSNVVNKVTDSKNSTPEITQWTKATNIRKWYRFMLKGWTFNSVKTIVIMNKLARKMINIQIIRNCSITFPWKSWFKYCSYPSLKLEN